MRDVASQIEDGVRGASTSISIRSATVRRIQVLQRRLHQLDNAAVAAHLVMVNHAAMSRRFVKLMPQARRR